jgi:hypothetical protein
MTTVKWELDEGIFCALSTTVSESHGQVACHELSEARSLPPPPPLPPPPEVAVAAVLLPGPTAVTVKVYEPDDEKPPSVHFDRQQEVPFAALQRFVSLVAATLDPDTT